MSSQPISIEVLVFAGCPHAEDAVALAREAAGRLAPDASVRRVEVETPERAAELGFLGSPSIRINGRDLEGRSGPGGLSCRSYDGAGVPPRWLVEAGVARALAPRGLLFLCVANSARSQMAEGIARSIAPAGVKVWSAGSEPTAIRPEAVAVMGEIGVDISAQRSKSVREIPASEVDLVVTLCAEEVCPAFLGATARLHWGMPDPAAAGGSDEERLQAFRKVRDELRRRLRSLLAPA